MSTFLSDIKNAFVKEIDRLDEKFSKSSKKEMLENIEHLEGRHRALVMAMAEVSAERGSLEEHEDRLRRQVADLRTFAELMVQDTQEGTPGLEALKRAIGKSYFKKDLF